MVCSVTLFLCLLGVTSSLAEMTVVDMTFDLGDDTIYWPGNPAFNFTIIARGNQSAGYWSVRACVRACVHACVCCCCSSVLPQLPLLLLVFVPASVV